MFSMFTTKICISDYFSLDIYWLHWPAIFYKLTEIFTLDNIRDLHGLVHDLTLIAIEYMLLCN